MAMELDRNFALREAARYNDADAEEHGSSGKVVEAMGLDVAEVRHVAEQRAMRMMLVLTGRAGELRRATEYNELNAIPFNEREREQIETMTLAYIDGIAIGWRGNQIREE